GAYLLARMIYNDGLNMMLTFGGIYAAGVFGWNLIELAAYGIVSIPFAALGGFLGGIIADRIGTKRALRLSLSGTILFGILSLGYTPTRVFFFFPYEEGSTFLPLPVFATLPELLYVATIAFVAISVVAAYANSR